MVRFLHLKWRQLNALVQNRAVYGIDCDCRAGPPCPHHILCMIGSCHVAHSQTSCVSCTAQPLVQASELTDMDHLTIDRETAGHSYLSASVGCASFVGQIKSTKESSSKLHIIEQKAHANSSFRIRKSEMDFLQLGCWLWFVLWDIFILDVHDFHVTVVGSFTLPVSWYYENKSLFSVKRALFIQ